MSKTWKQCFSGFFFASILINLNLYFIFHQTGIKTHVLLFILNLYFLLDPSFLFLESHFFLKEFSLIYIQSHYFVNMFILCLCILCKYFSNIMLFIVHVTSICILIILYYL